jgi:hypothetical protein
MIVSASQDTIRNRWLHCGIFGEKNNLKQNKEDQDSIERIDKTLTRLN